MEAEVVVKHQAVNPCCAALKDKYSKLEASRNALRQGIKIQNELIDKLQSENLNLKKAYEEDRARADSERQEKENESTVRVSLENEIAVLKSEILSLQQTGCSQAQNVDGEVMLLQTRLSELETEINGLKELVKKERMKADHERRKAEAEKIEANEARKIVKAEKSRAEEVMRLADIERKRVEENRIQLEKLKTEADEARSKLVLEAFKSEEANKKLEIERQKVIKQKKRADSEVSKAEEQRKLAEINQKKAMDEKCRADYLSQQLEVHRQRIEKLQKEMDKLVSLRKLAEAPADLSDKPMNAEAAKVNADESKLVLEYLKSEQVNKRLNEEKQKVIREKKRADSEMKKAEEQKKVAELNKKAAMEEKHRGDQLAQQLEDNTQKIEELQKEMLELVSSRTLVEAPVVLPHVNMNSEIAKMKLLKKQLKFKKKQVKHAKEVAKLEVVHNNILQHELCCLRRELVQFSHRLDVLSNCFSYRSEGSDDLGKSGNIFTTPGLNLRRQLFSKEPHQVHLHCNNELVKLSCTAMDASGCINEAIERNAPLLPTSGGNITQCISGIDSKLEPLVRGSNSKMLQSSAINSTTASFSDRPLMGSQERGAFSVTASAKLAEDKSNSQPKICSLSSEVTKTRYNENLAVVAENSVRSPVSTDTVGRRAGHSKKRRRIHDAVKSIEHIYSEGKKWHLRIEEKLSMLHGMLNIQTDKSLQEERCLVPDLEDDPYADQVRADKKRKENPVEEVALQHFCNSNEQEGERLGNRGIEEANICVQILPPASDLRGTAQACKDGVGDSGRSSKENLRNFIEAMEGNYTNLLDLDDAIDEECYRRAIEMPLSPSLPVIEFRSSGTFEIENNKHSVDESSYEGFSSAKDNPVLSCNFDVVNVEIDSNKLKLNTFETSHVPSTCKDEGVIYPSKNVADNENGECDIAYDGNACARQMWDSLAELVMSDLYSSGYKGTNISCQSTLGLAHDELPTYCVVFSDTKDSSSISRIFCATRSCMAQCSMISPTDQVMQKIMPALLKAEDLLPK